MASIKNEVFVSDIDEWGGDIGFASIYKSLLKEAENSRRITIITAYYSSKFISGFFKELARSGNVEIEKIELRILVGADSPLIAVNDISNRKKLSESLLKLKFKSLEIRVAETNGAPLHTKLFQFKKQTSTTYLVGSANASFAIGGSEKPGSRRELMIGITGKHAALDAYTEGLWESGTRLEDVAGTGRSAKPASLYDFLLNGYLWYRPQVTRSFTFDTIKPSREQRRKLSGVFSKGVEVRDADPKAEGFGFNLNAALARMNNESDYEESDQEVGKRLTKARPKSVQTAFGYWVPRSWGEELKGEFLSGETSLAQRLKKVKANMIGTDFGSVADEVIAQRTDWIRLFQKHEVEYTNLSAESDIDLKARFRKFWDKWLEWLDDDDLIAQLSRKIYVEAMPAFEESGGAWQRFDSSFFSNLALQLGLGRQSRIAKEFAHVIGDGTWTSKKLRAAVTKNVENGNFDDSFGNDGDDDEIDGDEDE
jgi:hypothetical protein